MSIDTQAKILDGKATAETVLVRVKNHVAALKEKTGKVPGLTVILVGDNPASQAYVKKKVRMAQEVGIHSELKTLPLETTEEALLETIIDLNNNPNVHGILVQLPLPSHINSARVLELISPDKDVDGFHPLNVGKLVSGLNPAAIACTPKGIITLFEHYEIPVSGQHVVIIGRSNIVGKPMAHLLLERNATVTICHSRTQNLPELVQQADIVIAALGRANFVRGSWIKPGAVVIDVGINRTEMGHLVGDVDFASVSEKASWITPVPGGVGPMTVATLMGNTANCFENSLLL